MKITARRAASVLSLCTLMFTAGCARKEGRGDEAGPQKTSRSPQKPRTTVNELAKELENQGFIVTAQPDGPEAQVSWGPEDEIMAVASAMREQEIEGFGSYGLGHGAIYVPVEQVEEALRFLDTETIRTRYPNLEVKRRDY